MPGLSLQLGEEDNLPKGQSVVLCSSQRGKLTSQLTCLSSVALAFHMCSGVSFPSHSPSFRSSSPARPALWHTHQILITSSTHDQQHSGNKQMFGLSSAGQDSATPKRSLVFSFWNFTATGRAEQVDKNAMHFPQTDTLYAFTKADKGCIEMICFISIANNIVSSLPNF